MGPSPSNFCAAASPSGVNEVDYCWYPARETQLQWLRYYLQAQKGMAVTPREVERLYVQVNKFALVSACDWKGWGKESWEEGLRAHPQLLLSHSLVVEEEAEPRVRGEVLGESHHMLLNPNLEGDSGKSHLGHPLNTDTLFPAFLPFHQVQVLSFLENYFQERAQLPILAISHLDKFFLVSNLSLSCHS